MWSFISGHSSDPTIAHLVHSLAEVTKGRERETEKERNRDTSVCDGRKASLACLLCFIGLKRQISSQEQVSWETE